MLNGNVIPSIEISNEDEKENVQPRQAQKLCRTSHPYHRCQDKSTNPSQTENPTVVRSSLKSPDSTAGCQDQLFYTESTGKGSKLSTSSSDSGTEADDESGVILQSLPAPPLKFRKGLKGQDGEGTTSPFLTPSYLDDESKRLELDRQLGRYSSLQNSPSTDDERRKIREKFTRRRRAEFLRRLSETLLLGAVGYISSIRQNILISGAWRPGTLQLSGAKDY